MIKKKTFDYSNNSLDFGFEYYASDNSSITLEEFTNMTKSSLFIYDTENCVLVELLRRNLALVNDNNKLFIGLVNNETLHSLEKLGVKTGIFRSTMFKCNCAVIVVDKSRVFLGIDANHIYEVKKDYSKEVFGYVNHLFWAQTQYEYFGTYNKVTELRLSVIEPDLSLLKNQNSNSVIFGTETFQTENMMISQESDTGRKSYLLSCSLPKAFSNYENELNINVFNDVYLPIDFHKNTLFKGESFKNRPLRDFANKKIWFKGKKFDIKEQKTITDTVYLTLNEIENYSPDFDKIAMRNEDLVCTLNVEVDVRPLTLNNTFKRHSNYKVREKAEIDLNNAIKKIENLNIDGIEKKLFTIKNTKILIDKIRLFNTFLKDEEEKIGDAILTLKEKNISPIIVSSEKIVVPSDLIGELYQKDGKTYLAINSESDYKDGKEWLGNNKMEGSIILKNAENN